MSDYIGSLINVISVVVFAWIVLKRKIQIEPWKLIVFVVLISVGLDISCYLNFTILKTLFLFISYVFLLRMVFSLDFIKSTILDFFYFIFLIISDMIAIKFFTLILGEELFYKIIAGHILGSFVVLLPLLILAVIFRRLLRKFLNTKVKYKLTFLLIASLMCIIAIFYATFSKGTNTADKLLCVFSIVVIVSVVGYSFVQAYNNNQLMLKYDNLLTFIKKYEIEIDNQRMMRHETKNQLLTIKSKIIDKEKSEDIVSYIDQLLNDDKKINHTEYAKLKYLPSNGIKGLFYFKMITAQEKNITVNVNISKNIENGFLSRLDATSFDQIGKILGVFLDNAIESAEISKNKVLGIEAFTKNGEVIFIISNTFDPNVKKIGRTSKGAGHGYGLLLVNNILNNNSKLSSSVEVVDNLYIEKLTIKE
jgi:hypothetical protein